MHTLVATLLVAVALVGGCGSNPVAEADRMLTADHVPNSGVMVNSRNGSIQLQADPAASGVSITASVRAAGANVEAAAARLEQVVVTASRDASGTLVVESTFPPPQFGNDGVSYTIVVPDAARADLRSSNGRLTARGIDGPVVLRTSNGAVTAERIAGDVEARSSNGRITIADVKGGADVETSNGAVSMTAVMGPITAESSNGAMEFRDVAGPIQAGTSNGSLVLLLRPDFAGTLEVSTSNGSVDLVGGSAVETMRVGKRDATLKFKAPGEPSRVRTSNGSVRVEVR